MTRSKNNLALSESGSEKKSARSAVSARKPKRKTEKKTGTFFGVTAGEPTVLNFPDGTFLGPEPTVMQGYLQPLPDQGTLPDGSGYKMTRRDDPEEVLCEECETPIPPARLKLVKHHICVDCMSELEQKGRGTVRHRMDVDTVGDIEDIEEVRVSIVRGE